MASPFDNVNSDFASRIRAMVAASGGRITIVSGYRSPERQQQLWGEALRKYGSAQAARQWVAPPGHSSHEKGEAFDLGGDLQLAHQLAPQFGLHFPMGHEPWHVERVGYQPGSSAAYTTPPAGGGVPAEQNGVSHVDNVFKLFGDLLSGQQSDLGLGEGAVTTTPGSDEATTANGLGAPSSGVTGTPSSGGNGGGDLDKFMRAIGGQESGGNYGSTNKSSGAHGKYQIMPGNWASWAKEAGLASNAPQTPENQELVARHKIQSYYGQFGDWNKVAKAWYSGPGNVNKNVGGGTGYPDSDTYARSVLSRMGAD